jgi:AraC-like DNA-binding protein
MTYHEITPGKLLQQYVKCYYVYESPSPVAFEDTVFPSGCMEIIFNLGGGNWQTKSGDEFITTPPVELWGQLNEPLAVRSVGCNTMLGVRFFSHAAACILPDKAHLFNNQVADYRAISGRPINTLHTRLQETASWNKRIALLEAFLHQQLEQAGKKLSKISVVRELMVELQQQEVYDTMETIATRYGISTRYMQQLFLHYTGLTPKLYSQVTRFQHSLRLVTARNTSLTDIAYECGYADQSHFIKEFKAFTGFTPSGYSQERSPVTVAVSQTELQEAEPLLMV